MENQTKNCFIFDIDGTLADGSHRNHLVKKPNKNWREYQKRAADDKHVLPVFRLLYLAWYTGNKIFICSGRSEDERVVTTKWFEEGFTKVDNKNISYILAPGYFHDHGSFSLLMRPSGDYRNDSIIKTEMLEKIRASGYEPVAVFDDRPRVVKMWREQGIFVFNCDQTAYGEDF